MLTLGYRIYLLLFVTCMLLTGTLQAQEVRYRVEVLVMSHLDHSAEPREFHRIDDYSSAIDYLTPLPPVEELDPDCVDETNEQDDAMADTMANDGGQVGEAAPGEPVEDQAKEELPRVLHVEEMSELMKENWRRLRLSAPFRPLQYLSWEQAADEPFPALRVHDLEVVLVEDPWAEQRALLEAEALEAAEDSGALTEAVTCPPVEDPNNPEGIDKPELPDPVVYYRLDGTITLRRSRFLHLDIMMDWREPVFSQFLDTEDGEPDRSSLLPSYPDAEPVGSTGVDGVSEQPPVPSAFMVHRLNQSRLVRTDRLEYFDHPVLGVLAHITRFEIAEEPEEAN